MNDPWAWASVWGLIAGVGMGLAEEGKEGKIRTTVRITVKKIVIQCDNKNIVLLTNSWRVI